MSTVSAPSGAGGSPPIDPETDEPASSPSTKSSPGNEALAPPPGKQPASAWDRLVENVFGSDAEVEARAVRLHAYLAPLTPREYLATLEAMDRSGELESNLADFSPGQLARFLEQGVAKGVLRRYEGVPSPGADPTGRYFEPPAIPSHIRPAGDVPETIEAAIVRHNNHLIGEYRTAYAEYVDRYALYIQQANQPDVLAELGQWVPPHNFGDMRPYCGVPATFSQVKALDAWTAQNQRIAGETPSGVSVQVWQKAKFTEGQYQLETKDVFSVDPNGTLTRDEGLKIGIKEGKLGAAIGLDGKQTYTLGPLQVMLDAKEEFSGAALKVKGYGFKFEGNGRGGVTLEGQTNGVGAHVVLDPARATMGYGVSYETKVGDDTVTHGATVLFRGLQDDAGERFIEGDGTVRLPAELREGKRWEDLPTLRRQQLGTVWTQERWNRYVSSGGDR